LDAPLSDQRDALSRLRSLLVLAQLMMESTTEDQILQLAAGAARSLAPCAAARVEMGDAGSGPSTPPFERPSVEGGPRPEGTWAFPLHSGAGNLGWLVVQCPSTLSDEEQFLLRALGQHAGAAITNRRLHEQERAAVAEAERVNDRLEATLSALRESMEIHERLTAVATSGEGREGIARAVHDLTGLAVAVEDRFGNLRGWAGPDRPDPYAKQSPARRDELVRRALKSGRPIHVADRWFAFTRPQPDVIGALVMFDPDGCASDQQLIALEHGVTVLAIELTRLRSLAESELRVRRDFVEELLAGTDEESALRRAVALRYDLERPHRVAVAETAVQASDEFLHAVRRAARDEPAGTLLIRRGSQVVLLADREADWEHLRRSIVTEARGASCRLGVGNLCINIADYPRSLRQADTALRVQRSAGWAGQATRYEDLGVFQLLAEVEDPAATEAYVSRWLSALLEYDEARNAGLTHTLARYLGCGGSYADTSAALFIHRSTLKYRLQRIREISGFDLNDPDIRFNLQLACKAWETLSAMRAPT
jgi:sugar diacid utilization regulator